MKIYLPVNLSQDGHDFIFVPVHLAEPRFRGLRVVGPIHSPVTLDPKILLLFRQGVRRSSRGLVGWGRLFGFLLGSTIFLVVVPKKKPHAQKYLQNVDGI